jgi:hypothetical protein
MLKLLALIILSFVHSNIWDNLYSNLRSPQFKLKFEFKLQLYNQDKEIINILYSSIFNSIKISILDEDVITNFSIVDVYINFAEAKVNMDFSDKCLFKAIPGIDAINTAFLMDSYDLFTFYRKAEKFYEYIIANPYSSEKKEDNPLLQFAKDLDKEASLIFRVGKESQALENIDFKYKGFVLTAATTKVTTKVEFKDIDFKPKHDCKLYEEYK